MLAVNAPAGMQHHVGVVHHSAGRPAAVRSLRAVAGPHRLEGRPAAGDPCHGIAPRGPS